MARRINFKRSRGILIDAGRDGLPLVEPRLRFVKPAGGEPAYGVGTKYPLLVTMEELTEIVYGVRDWRFDGGGFTFVAPNGTLTVSAVTTTPPAKMAFLQTDSGDHEFQCERGYLLRTTIPDVDRPSLGTYYDIDWDGGDDTQRYRDFISEEAMWLGGSSFIMKDLPESKTFGFQFTQLTPNVFDDVPNFGIASSYTNSDGDTSNIGGDAWCVSELVVCFTGTSPTDPDGELWLSLWFNTLTDFGVIESLGTLDYGVYTNYCDLILQLSGGRSVTCPLYGPTGYTSVTDFVMKPLKWWPYAKEDESPMYDEDTGLPL